jgi:hypothetical protein
MAMACLPAATAPLLQRPARKAGAGNQNEARILQVGDQLANLARHMLDIATYHSRVPARIQPAGRGVLENGYEVLPIVMK